MRTFQSTFIKSSKTQSSHSRYSNGRGSLFSLTPIVYLLRSRIRNPHREVRQNTMANSTMKEFSNWKCVMVRPFIRTHDLLQPTLSNEPVLPQSLTSKIPVKDENGEGFSVLVLASSQMLDVLLCILKWYGHYPDQTTPPLNSENGFCCPLNLGLSCKTICTLHKIF